MSGTVPSLSYIGSVDTSTANTGTVMFSIDFDPDIRVLMFEYKYQPTSVLNPTPGNLQYSGFIYPESVQPVQGSNHEYYLPIPALTAVDSYNVSVRVYDAANLGVSDWSNELFAYAPPIQPLITSGGAVYDRGSTNSMLWINLDPVSLSPNNSYIVSYYYVPEGVSHVTTWVVTDLINLTGQSNVLEVEMNGVVSNDPGYTNVYVAVNAVYTFEGTNSGGYPQTYYSVSEISNTETATQGEINPPTLDAIVYDVYDDGSQTMNLSWTPPSISIIPAYGVASYMIQQKINTGSWTDLMDVSGTILSAAIDVSNTTTYPVLNTNVAFRVYATFQSGTVTDPSDVESENIFYYAGAPASLFYSWAVYDEANPGMVTVSFTFTNPSSTGSGAVGSFVWQIIQNAAGSLSVVASGTEAYSGAAPQYDLVQDFAYVSANIYYINVFLQTTDTNSSALLDGASITSSSIVPSTVPFIFSVSSTSNSVTFKVSSGVLLNPTAEIYFTNLGTGAISSIVYDTTLVTPVNFNDSYVYTFTLTGPIGLVFANGNYVITASNQAGIGSYIYNVD